VAVVVAAIMEITETTAMATVIERRRSRRPRRRAGPGPDRVTVLLVTLASFLGVLALLAGQLRSSGSARPRAVVVIRRVYETRVVETDRGRSSGVGGTSISQAVSNASPASVPSAPTTRSS
jgi:nitrate reductase gamma subunit